MMHTRRVIVAVIGVLVLTSHASHALVVCVGERGEGTLKLREDCKNKEVEVDLTPLVDVDPPVEAPAVYDAVGNKVGPMLPWADDARFVARVGFTHGTQYYSLVLVRDKALGNGVNLWFLLDDCQGDAYLSVSHRNRMCSIPVSSRFPSRNTRT